MVMDIHVNASDVFHLGRKVQTMQVRTSTKLGPTQPIRVNDGERGPPMRYVVFGNSRKHGRACSSRNADY
jgi:hypothetical protein